MRLLKSKDVKDVLVVLEHMYENKEPVNEEWYLYIRTRYLLLTKDFSNRMVKELNEYYFGEPKHVFELSDDYIVKLTDAMFYCLDVGLNAGLCKAVINQYSKNNETLTNNMEKLLVECSKKREAFDNSKEGNDFFTRLKNALN